MTVLCDQIKQKSTYFGLMASDIFIYGLKLYDSIDGIMNTEYNKLLKENLLLSFRHLRKEMFQLDIGTCTWLVASKLFLLDQFHLKPGIKPV